MRAPSRLSFGEGRRDRSNQPTREDQSARRGSGRSTHARSDARHGIPVAERDGFRNRPIGAGLWQESEGLIVPRKPGNAGGGKGPWFGVCLDETRGGGLA